MTIHINVIIFFSDIDECADLTNTCEHTCTNTEGSYTCGCESGYVLHDNGKSCSGK